MLVNSMVTLQFKQMEQLDNGDGNFPGLSGECFLSWNVLFDRLPLAMLTWQLLNHTLDVSNRPSPTIFSCVLIHTPSAIIFL